MDQKQAVQELAEAGCIVEKNALQKIQEEHVDKIKELSPKPMIVNEQLITNISTALDTAASTADDTDDDEVAQAIEDHGQSRPLTTSVDILTEIDMEKEKRTVQDFVEYYNNRYERIKNLLLRRRDIQSAMSISHMENRSEGDEVSVVGLVEDKYKTNSGKWIVYIEDPTGRTKLLVEEQDGEHIIQDEVIGANGSLGDNILFCDDVIWPDLPLPSDETVNTADEEVYAAFISDIHFGSIDTLNDTIDVFVDWLNAETEFTEKVKYLFVVGDMVEGVGIYPGQEDELRVTNIHDQYQLFIDMVNDIRDDIEIIVGSGNHDMVRLAEPQPPVPREYAEELYEMDNVHMVPNPCWVEIHGHNGDGINVLMYHGYSFDEHVSTLQHLRETAYENPDTAMVDFLKRRHLAPIYGSNLLVPDETDHHVIDEIPDIFCMGHTHSFANTTYKGVNVICAGTFQDQTDFQERVGHEPDPGKVSVINLQSRESTVKQFYHPDEDDDDAGDEQ
jgi:DNA polymerase II small subunit